MNQSASIAQSASERPQRVSVLAPWPAYHRRLEWGFLTLAILLGSIQAWSTRHITDPDAVSYLDMGDAFMRQDWSMALNAYWSPLYPWLVGAFRAVVNPSPYWEYATMHLLNFVIYLVALLSFRFFLNEFIRHQGFVRSRTAGAQSGLPPAECLILGYTLFLWASIVLIQLRLLGPDMMIAAFAYVLTGMLLRMQNSGADRRAGALFGFVLALSYFTKVVMFPLALVFLTTGMVGAESFRTALRRMVPAALVFVLVSAVWIVPISAVRGRLTIGSAATLNYAWSGGASNRHWRGNAGEGAPSHPTREVPAPIPVFEFATPIGGTYPFWYDPSYWFEGLKPAADVASDVQNRGRYVIENVVVYVTDFSLGGSLVFGLLVLSLMRSSRPIDVATIWEYRSVLVPASAALTIFVMVWLVPRMLGPWLLLFYLGAYATRLLPNSVEARRLMRAVVSVIVVSALAVIGVATARAATAIAREMADGPNAIPNRNWHIAHELRRMGLREGDRVAAMRVVSATGLTHSMWARLAKVRVVVEAETREVDAELDEPEILEAIASTGVTLIVADAVPRWSQPASWKPIGQTGYFARFLPRQTF